MLPPNVDVHLTIAATHRAKCHADGLRAKVYNIGSIWQELRHWFGGLSVEISKVMTTLYKVRGQIAVRHTALYFFLFCNSNLHNLLI